LPGESHRIVNVGQYPIVLVNQSASSVAYNRLLCDNNANITLLPNEQADVLYDTYDTLVIVGDGDDSESNTIESVARWRVTKLGSATAVDGSGDTGWVEFVDNPSDGETIVINTVVVTFLLVAGAFPQVPIGATLKATMLEAVERLNASVNPLLSIATYETDGVNRIIPTLDEKGTKDTDTFALTAGTTVGATVSAATLDGATDRANRSLTAFRTTRIAFTNDTPGTIMSLTVTKTGTYKIESFLSVSAGGSELGVRFDGGTATVSSFIGVWKVYNVTGGFNELFGVYIVDSTDDVPNCAGATTADLVYEFTGTATFSTTGTFDLDGSQFVPDADDTGVEIGSSLEARPL
jgi:hypothetical protein